MDAEQWVLTEAEKTMEEVVRLVDSNEMPALLVMACMEENRGILRIVKAFDQYLDKIYPPTTAEDEAAQLVAKFYLKEEGAVFNLYEVASELITANCAYVLDFVGECLLLLDRIPAESREGVNYSFGMKEDGSIGIRTY